MAMQQITRGLPGPRCVVAPGGLGARCCRCGVLTIRLTIRDPYGMESEESEESEESLKSINRVGMGYNML